MARKTILIVDDDKDIRTSLTDVLEDENYQVASASDGMEALRYLHTHPAPALILLDWMMPNCDGACFRRQQREDPELASIPVVLLTADARVDSKLAEISVTEYVAKPVRLEKLLAIIARHAGPPNAS